MRRRIAAPLVFAAAVTTLLLHDDTPARAVTRQGPTIETVVTADGVQLTGEFHKSKSGGGNDPVVILLYPPGVDRNMDKGNWKSLVGDLTEANFHVFRFDWRGHGKSTVVKGNTFWSNTWTGPHNLKHIKGANKKPNAIQVKDFSAAYFPMYVNDLAAVRAHLDQKNDLGDLNTSSIYLIGGEEAAALGLFWLTAEWSKPAVYAAQPMVAGYEVIHDQRFATVQNDVNRAAGANYAGCVWLTPARPTAFPEGIVKQWVAKDATSIRENNPMLFLYGEKDAAGKRVSEFLYKDVLLADPRPGSPLKKLDQTFIRDVKGTALKGGFLLGDNAKTGVEDTIKKYLAAIQKERAKVARKPRTYSAPYFVDLGAFGVKVP